MAPAGKKTCTVLLVDVSAPSMTPHLGWIGDALSRVVQNRMMHAKADEFALVTCGARETKNDVHTEGLENAARFTDLSSSGSRNPGVDSSSIQIENARRCVTGCWHRACVAGISVGLAKA